MASTLYSTQVTRGDVPRAVTPGVYSVYGNWTSTTALVVNDVIQMCKVPLGARVLKIDLYVSDLDAGATPAITLDIGDGTDTASAYRFVQNSTIGQAGGSVTFPGGTGAAPSTGFGYQYTTNDTIDVKVSTAPQTAASTQTMKMVCMFSIDD